VVGPESLPPPPQAARITAAARTKCLRDMGISLS
jgi:hypothetical protein